MTKLSKSTILKSQVVAFDRSAKGGAVTRQPAVRPILRSVWHVSPTTGRLQCAWIDDAGDAAILPYSMAS